MKRSAMRTRKKNPHLTSGKWRFFGMFEKQDVNDIRRMFRVNGIRCKFTKDHKKHERGMRELYVDRNRFVIASNIISTLYIPVVGSRRKAA